MEITNISMDPNQPYMLGQLDPTIFPDGIPLPSSSLELSVLPSPPAPLPADSAENLDIYA